jgi:hypothetical protein
MTDAQHEEIMQVLRGDLRGTPGLLQNVLRLMNDIYTPVEGIAPRLREIEKWRLMKEERAAGAIWMARVVWGIVWAIVGASLTVIFKH